MSSETVKKILGIASKVISWIIIAITVFMMAFTVFSTLVFDKNDRNLFGIRFYVVLSDSMSLSENNKDLDVHFDAGDIVLIKNLSEEEKYTLQPGQIVAFISQNPENVGETVTHMIREVRETEEGNVIGYQTYGTNTGVNDKALLEPSYVLGTYAGKLPAVGSFFQFLKTTPGYIICILVPFILLILWQGANTIRLFRQYKKEQMADMEAERAKLAQEREESAEMMRELIALREQLAKQGAGAQNETEQPAENNECSETSESFTENNGSDETKK